MNRTRPPHHESAALARQRTDVERSTAVHQRHVRDKRQPGICRRRTRKCLLWRSRMSVYYHNLSLYLGFRLQLILPSKRPPSSTETLLYRSFSTRSRLCRPRRPPLASRRTMLTTSRPRSACRPGWCGEVSTCYRIYPPYPRAVTGYMGFLGAREQRSSIRAGLSRYCRRDQDCRTGGSEG